MTKPSPPEINMLAAEACMSPSTVRRVFAGRGNQYSRTRVVNACVQLGIPKPPEAPAAEEQR